MSTVKANNHQIGQSGTASQNFTLYQPSTPDGTVRLAVGNSGATTGDVLSVSSTGLSVTGTLTSTGVNTFPAGSASAPSITTTGDTNTGVYFPGADSVAITTGGTAAVTVDSGQRTKFPTTIGIGNATPSTSGSGITFPASQSASSDANTLDDYEEGSYTPTDSSGASLSFTNAYGYYTKVGRLVTYNFAVTYPSTASGSNAKISLPFTQSSGMDGNASTGGFMFYVYGATTSAIMPIIASGGNSLGMYFQSSMSDVKNADLSSKTLRGMVIFYV